MKKKNDLYIYDKLREFHKNILPKLMKEKMTDWERAT